MHDLLNVALNVTNKKHKLGNMLFGNMKAIH